MLDPAEPGGGVSTPYKDRLSFRSRGEKDAFFDVAKRTPTNGLQHLITRKLHPTVFTPR